MPDEFTYEGVMEQKNSINHRLSQGHAKIASKDDPAVKAAEQLKESLRKETVEGNQLLANHERDMKVVQSNPVARLSLMRAFDTKEAELLEKRRKGLLTPIDD